MYIYIYNYVYIYKPIRAPPLYSTRWTRYAWTCPYIPADCCP